MCGLRTARSTCFYGDGGATIIIIIIIIIIITIIIISITGWGGLGAAQGKMMMMMMMMMSTAPEQRSTALPSQRRGHQHRHVSTTMGVSFIMGGKPPMVEGPIVLEALTAMVTAPLAGLAGQGGCAG